MDPTAVAAMATCDRKETLRMETTHQGQQCRQGKLDSDDHGHSQLWMRIQDLVSQKTSLRHHQWDTGSPEGQSNGHQLLKSSDSSWLWTKAIQKCSEQVQIFFLELTFSSQIINN